MSVEQNGTSERPAPVVPEDVSGGSVPVSDSVVESAASPLTFVPPATAPPGPPPVHYAGEAYPSQYPVSMSQTQQHSPSPAMYPHEQRNGGYTSLVLGIIAVSFAIFLGWIPFIGILGVGVGIGLGIPAIIQGGKEGANGMVGKVLGWVAICFSALFITFYMVALSGSIGSSNGDHRSPSLPPASNTKSV
jgi:hypothetical protein